MAGRPTVTARRLGAARALIQAFRGSSGPDAPGVTERMAALPRLLAASLNGRYPGMGRSRLVLMALAVVYVVSPVDLMPEGLLLFFGLGDDALVAAWLAGTVLAETDSFLRWERARERVVPGEVIRGASARS